MKRSSAVLAPLLCCAAFGPAAAQELAGFGVQLAAFRDQAQAQKKIAQRPKVMGAAERFTIGAPASAEPDVTAYAVRGVDVSHFQGEIAWDQVKKDGLSFAYIKATEGAEGTDQDFARNWRGAADAGLMRGAYHFYNFCRNGSDQADNFIKTVPADADALPATIDLEQSPDCRTMPAKTAFRADLAAFVAKIRAAYGSTPILYVNYEIYAAYFRGENDSFKLWITDVSHKAPILPDDAAWTMWQYAWHGRLAGIAGEVDLDVFNGTPQMLASLAGGSSGVLLAGDPR